MVLNIVREINTTNHRIEQAFMNANHKVQEGLHTAVNNTKTAIKNVPQAIDKTVDFLNKETGKITTQFNQNVSNTIGAVPRALTSGVVGGVGEGLNTNSMTAPVLLGAAAVALMLLWKL